MKVFQQGDVNFFMVKMPKGAEVLKDHGPIVQFGEHTGHAHRLHGEGFTFFTDPKTKARHLRLVQPTALRHEEHKEIMLPPGDYRIGIVREYDHFEEESREVLD